jgi:nitrite reductase (NADH) large subunit
MRRAHATFMTKPDQLKSLPRLLIVGNGMVGWKLCDLLVRESLNRLWKITVIGKEPRPAYDRVHLTDYLAHRRPESLELAPRSWYSENLIDLHTGDPAVALDRSARTVRLRSGAVHSYDKLVLATGSRAFVPPFEGHQLDSVLVYRTIEDLESIVARARIAHRVVVMGGGLLGLEAARALMDLGLKTHVIERGSGLMARQLTPAASALLRTKIEELGVRIHTPKHTQSVSAHEFGLRITFTDATHLDTDLLIVAAGITPRDELARNAGLACSRRGGIEVNDFLTTSDPAIHAIGECASHRGVTYGLAAPGYLMAELLVEALAGKPRRFTRSPLATRLKLLGVDVFSAGDFQRDAESLVHRDADTYRELIIERGHVIGALSIGPNPEAARCQDLAERRRWLSPWRRNRFLKTGRLWPVEVSDDPNEWPADAIVCSCKGITRGALSAACRSGATTADALAACTGASTVCGSCRPLVAQLAGASAAAATQPASGARPLLVFSSVATLVALAILFLHPIPVGKSVEHAGRWEFLLLDTFWRQVTGFSVLGCAVISLVLSLRKRIRLLANLGAFGWWRVAHVTLGLLGVATLIAHTGLRLGDNFNRVLMLDFLALIALGSGAGIVAAIENRLDPRNALRLRRGWTLAHIFLVWPLPALVGFHIFSAYYY